MSKKVYASQEYVNEAIENVDVVYIGSGEMPDKYNLQIDPEGEVWYQKETLAEIVTEEDQQEILVSLSKDPFEFSTLLITITSQKIDDLDSQFWGKIYNTNKSLMVTHLNTLFSSSEERTISVYVKLFEFSAFVIAVPMKSYLWQSNTFYCKEYQIEDNTNQELAGKARFWTTNSKAGTKITIQGVR